MKISIITPVFNAIDYIESAILNVREQDYDNVEHIIVDGGSTDGTVEVLKRYPHLKWISEPDRGQTHAMNKGFRMSDGDIIVYLNVDDYFLPGAFREVIRAFKQGAKFVAGQIRIDKEIGDSFLNDPKVGHLDILHHWKLNAYPYNAVGYFYLREVYEAVGGFNENNYMQDLEFLVAASYRYDFTKIDVVLGVYRDYEQTITQRSQKRRDYWTRKNFSFLNFYIEQLPQAVRKQYEYDRKLGYREQRKIQQWKKYERIRHQVAQHQEISFWRKFSLKVRLLLGFPDKRKWLFDHLKL